MFAMIIIGHELLAYERFVYVNNKEEISYTKANSSVLFVYEKDLLKYSSTHQINFSVLVSSIEESIYANALNAQYLLCEKDLAIKVQKIAEHYMFDTKVLCIIEKDHEIEELAVLGIDGIVYKNSINKNLKK